MKRWNEVSWTDDDGIDDFLTPDAMRDQDDAQSEEEDDFLRPVALEVANPAELDQWRDSEPVGLLADDEEIPDHWEPSLGFSSLTNALRIWADQDGIITKIRVSLGWRERVRKSSLSEAFDEALVLLNNYYRSVDTSPVPVFASDIPEVESKLTWESLADVQRRLAELNEQIAELGNQPTAIWDGQQQVADALDGKIRVVLSLHGELSSVEFDQAWLDTKATASEISRGVLGAYQQARSRFTTPRLLLTPKGELVERKRATLLELFGQARNGLG